MEDHVVSLPADHSQDPTSITTIDEFAEYLKCYLDTDEIATVRKAYTFADIAHQGQTRRSGEAYITHPLAVSIMLSQMRMDCPSLCAALLHDVIEDTHFCKADIENAFSAEVAELVDSLTKLTHISFDSKAHAQAENFQKMAMAMAKDIRVILIKMSDRLHNMRTLGALKPEKKRRISRETLEIYAPIAQRLGMNTFRLEFEELGFEHLYPLRRKRIKSAVEKKRGNRREIIDNISEAIAVRLEQEGIDAGIAAREKHLYSIYNKMKRKAHAFDEITDVFGCRITVDNVDTCYRVLGIIHSMYKPKPGMFKDYIAIPKQNGYQSLHTLLFGMHSIPIEVQIRTKEMDAMADNGIAAHWLYKSRENYSADPAHARARDWLQSLLDIQERVGSSLEFVEHVKDDLFPDEVYVFTPKGAITELPSGATAIDFAYSVHTQIGNHCMGCRINNNIAPLSVPLKSGQTVEIITDPGAYPKPSWLDVVVTGRARSAIRHFLRNQKHKGESIHNGHIALDNALKSLGSSLETLSADTIDNFINSCGAETFDEILNEIGIGERTSILTAHALISAEGQHLDINPNLLRDALTIYGNEGAVLNYGKCCRPIPGDPIVGKINTSKGVVVHRTRCNIISQGNENDKRLLDLHWAEQTHGEFLVSIRVTAFNRRGIFAKVASAITGHHSDIAHIETHEIDANLTNMDLVIGVQNRVHLARILRQIRTLSGIEKVIRISQ